VKPSVSKSTIAFLSLLYFSQGLPFGFQANALSLYLTDLGLSMTKVSFARALSLPWLLKFLWAPLVDRFYSASFGKRKSWIVPAQLALSLTCFAAAFVAPHQYLMFFLFLVLLMNFFAATQDIAVDGFAVDTLQPHELGAGNSAQVVGYKIGMLTGGGLLVALSKYMGWQGLFMTLSALTLAVALWVFIRPEAATGPAISKTAPHDFKALWPHLKLVLQRPGAGWFLLAVFTYKMGEALADAMFGPFLLKVYGLEKETVALWIGSWGLVASLLGSLVGGFLASRWPVVKAVWVGAVFRILPLVLQWLMSTGLVAVTASTVIPVTMAEHFFGGILTTAMFAFMMSQVDREIGATHFTILASLEVLGKSPAGILSGALVDALGFQAVFLLAVVLAAGFLVVLLPLKKNAIEARAPND
jgi:MFS transporter, PAT family, beta-lactamase induction signal transducer AmpG